MLYLLPAVETYDSIAKTAAACTVAAIMNAHVHVVLGRYILFILVVGTPLEPDASPSR